jgi:predicted small lipoprotein YifL
MRGAMQTLFLSAVSVAILSAALLGCGGRGSLPGPPPSSSAATLQASPSGTGSAQAQARQAYLAMWAAYVAASRTDAYQSTSLARYAAGAALSVLTHGLYADYQAGIVTRGKPSFDPRVMIVTAAGGGQQADIADCADSSGWSDYTRSGKLIPAQQQGRRQITARLQPFRQAGGTEWKVTYLNVGRAGTC